MDDAGTSGDFEPNSTPPFNFAALQETLLEMEDTPGGASSSDIMPSSCAEETVPKVESSGAEETVPNVESRDGECAVCLTAAANTYFTCGHQVCSQCYETIMEAGTSYQQSKCPLCRRVQFQPPPRRMEYTAPPMVIDPLEYPLSYPGTVERPWSSVFRLTVKTTAIPRIIYVLSAPDLAADSTVKKLKEVIARKMGLTYRFFIDNYTVSTRTQALTNNRLKIATLCRIGQLRTCFELIGQEPALTVSHNSEV